MHSFFRSFLLVLLNERVPSKYIGSRLNKATMSHAVYKTRDDIANDSIKYDVLYVLLVLIVLGKATIKSLYVCILDFAFDRRRRR